MNRLFEGLRVPYIVLLGSNAVEYGYDDTTPDLALIARRSRRATSTPAPGRVAVAVPRGAEARVALRAAAGVGGDVGRPLGSLERVSVYYELVALDLMLGYWIGNPASLVPSDVFSLALGLRVER